MSWPHVPSAVAFALMQEIRRAEDSDRKWTEEELLALFKRCYRAVKEPLIIEINPQV